MLPVLYLGDPVFSIPFLSFVHITTPGIVTVVAENRSVLMAVEVFRVMLVVPFWSQWFPLSRFSSIQEPFWKHWFQWSRSFLRDTWHLVVVIL